MRTPNWHIQLVEGGQIVEEEEEEICLVIFPNFKQNAAIPRAPVPKRGVRALTNFENTYL